MKLTRILAIKARSLGDTVLLTASLKQLARLYPSSKIDVLVPRTYSSVLENLPGINWIIPFDRPTKKIDRVRYLVRLGLALRKENYDCALNFHASPSTAWLAWLTRAPIRSIHFHDHTKRNSGSTVEVPGKGTLKPILERDMDTVRAIGSYVPTGTLPEVHLTSKEREEAIRWRDEHHLRLPTLGLSFGASRATKRWPLQSFCELARAWCSQTDGSVAIFLGPGEQELGVEFLRLFHSLEKTGSSLRKRLLLEDDLSIRTLASRIQQMSVFLGNDSGPRHLAVAVGTPTVTVFGPEHPYEWHPYPLRKHPYFFTEGLDCRTVHSPGMPGWCGLSECVLRRHECMKRVSASEVLETCIRIAQGVMVPAHEE